MNPHLMNDFNMIIVIRMLVNGAEITCREGCFSCGMAIIKRKCEIHAKLVLTAQNYYHIC